MQDWCSEHGGLDYIETSAKDNVSVEEAFNKLIEKGMNREKVNQFNLPDRMSSEQKKVSLQRDVKSNVNRKGKKQKCC